MICKTCGGETFPGEKFCRYCGTPVPVQSGPAAPQPPLQPACDAGFYGEQPTNPPRKESYAPGARQPAAPIPQEHAVASKGIREAAPAKKAPKYAAPKKKGPGKKGLIIGAIAGAVAVIALVVVLILTGNPAAKVASAFAATGKELTAVADTLQLSAVGEVLEQEALSHDLDAKIRAVDSSLAGSGATALTGLGIRLQLDADLDNHQLGLQAVPYYGSTDILNLMVAMEEDMFYLSLPEILPDDCYGVSTMTLMADLENMGLDVGEAESVKFNFFEIMDLIRTRVEEDQTEAAQILKDATTKLVKSVQVEKEGKRNVRVNGISTKCTGYTVIIPQRALEDWLDAVEEYSGGVDYSDILEEAFEAMNLPGDIVDELVRELEGYTGGADLSDLIDLVDEIGDVELEVYVSGGKVAAVIFDEEIYGDDVEIGLYIGGKDNYVDELSVEVILGNEEYVLTSEGNHTAKGGIFTDELTYCYSYNDNVYSEFTLTTSLDTKAREDNLELELEAESAKISLEGTWKAEKGRLTLDADSIGVSVEGQKVLSLSFSYTADRYTRRVDTNGARLLATFDEESIAEFIAEVETKGTQWAMELMGMLPELQYLF